MHDAPILICYDGSDGARNAITVAAELLLARRAVVLDVAPVVMVAEPYVTPGSEVAELDQAAAAVALARAEEGAQLARKAGFRAEARSDVDTPTWEGVIYVGRHREFARSTTGSWSCTS